MRKPRIAIQSRGVVGLGHMRRQMLENMLNPPKPLRHDIEPEFV